MLHSRVFSGEEVNFDGRLILPWNGTQRVMERNFARGGYSIRLHVQI